MIEIRSLVEPETKQEIFDKVVDLAANGMNFVEVGTFLGGSICYLGQKLKEKGVKVNLTAIDNFKFDLLSATDLGEVLYNRRFYETYLENIEKCKIDVNTLVGDSIEKSWEFKHKSIDFLFLDGNHEKDYPEREIMAWLPKMKDNSMIACHDYTYIYVKNAALKIFGDNIKQTTNGYSYYVEFGKGITKNWWVDNYYKFKTFFGRK